VLVLQLEEVLVLQLEEALRLEEVLRVGWNLELRPARRGEQ